MGRIICMLFVLLLPSMAFAEENGRFCASLEDQESYLTEKEKKTLEKHGFVVGTSRESREKYPKVLVSKSVESSCRTRYLIAGYFSDKIDGKENFMKNISLSENERQKFANASCKALELTTNGSGVWFDGMGHEIYNVVDDIIFPYFFSCISDRITLNKSIGPEYFSPNAFQNPSKNLVDLVFDNLQKNLSEQRTDEISESLFILKNGGRLAGMNIDLILRSGRDPKLDISQEEIIKISKKLLKQESKVTLNQYWDLSHQLWGY